MLANSDHALPDDLESLRYALKLTRIASFRMLQAIDALSVDLTGRSLKDYEAESNGMTLRPSPPILTHTFNGQVHPAKVFQFDGHWQRMQRADLGMWLPIKSRLPGGQGCAFHKKSPVLGGHFWGCFFAFTDRHS